MCQGTACIGCDSVQVFFGFDSYDLTEDARSVLDRTSSCLAKLRPGSIVIEGHADPRGTTEYNLALSQRRAAEVRQYLTDHGVTRRLDLRPRGSLDARGHDEDGWAMDRNAALTVAARGPVAAGQR